MPDEKPPPPLFRPEASGEREFGEAFAFAVPSWRALGLLVLIATLIFSLFGLFANFDREAHVQGIIVPSSGIARLTAPQAGTVTAIMVEQGDIVRKGDPIAKISANTFLPNGASAFAQMLQTYQRQQDIAAEEQQAEQKRGEAERRRLNEQIGQFSAASQSFSAQIALQRQRITANEKRLKNLEPLRAKGYVSDVTYQAQAEAVLTLRQQLAGLQQNLANARHDLAQAQLRTGELAAEQRQIALRSAAAIMELERGATTAQANAEATVTAPVTGKIGTLNVMPGATVAAADQIATVIPTTGALEVLLFVPSYAAGSLRAGQPVKIRYDAFPYQRYGLGHGIISEIATTATQGQTSANGRAPDIGYRVRVKLFKRKTGVPLSALRPDMTLAASIVLEKRSLLDWLFAPLRQKWLESK
jgi:membrane fusion protein